MKKLAVAFLALMFALGIAVLAQVLRPVLPESIRKVSPSTTSTTNIITAATTKPIDATLVDTFQLDSYALGNLTVDLKGNIYIVDGLSRSVLILGPNGDITSSISVGIYKLGDNTFAYSPNDVVLDSSGNIYIALSVAGGSGTIGGEIKKFDNAGKEIKAWGRQTSQPGLICNPRSIALDSAGNLYFIDWASNYFNSKNALKRIVQTSLDPVVVAEGTGSGPGQFNFPAGIAIKGNYIYVLDSGNYRIKVLRIDSSGQIVETFITGGKGTAQEQFNYSPKDLAVDSKGRVFVTEANSIKVFAEGKKYIGKLDVPGADKIAIDAAGFVYISSFKKISKYKLNI